MNVDELVNRLYLGDGVYAGTNKHTGLVWLYTHDYFEVTNEIALEPKVIDQFKTWLEWSKNLKNQIS